MRILLISTAITIALLSGTSAMTQTPDGQAPAEENVCDPLKTDGITKGLYGLCVAFCEAQDHADLSNIMTDADLALLEDQAPSGRILANYNKLKQGSDPEMPCIFVEQPCPCWSAEELGTIDGINANDGSAMLIRCVTRTDPVTGLIDGRDVIEFDPTRPPGSVFQFARARDFHRDNLTQEQCRFSNRQAEPDTNRFLSVEAGTLTHDQAAECLAQVNARCDELGL